MPAFFRRAMRMLLPMLAIGALLTACGGPSYPLTGGDYAQPRTPHPVYKVGAPYEIKGVRYTPQVNYEYDETGTASWYGEAFQGQYTANGEIYDLNQLTAAHRTLPMPSIVEVTNLNNNRALRLRVNDRGPFAQGRILDVSRRAAQLLGFERTGTTPVRVRVLPGESIAAAEEIIRQSGQSPTILARETPRERRVPATYVARAAPPMSSPPMSYPQMPFSRMPRRIFVQAGAFSEASYAMRVGSAIAPLGSVAIVTTSEPGGSLYRVQLGPVASDREAEALRARLVGGGYPEARIVVN